MSAFMWIAVLLSLSAGAAITAWALVSVNQCEQVDDRESLYDPELFV